MAKQSNPPRVEDTLLGQKPDPLVDKSAKDPFEGLPPKTEMPPDVAAKEAGKPAAAPAAPVAEPTTTPADAEYADQTTPTTSSTLAVAEPKKEATKAPLIARVGGHLDDLDFEQAWRLAQALIAAGMVPSSWTDKAQGEKGKTAAVAICLMFGRENDLSFTETVNCVYIVRGKPTLWGDIIGAKVLASGLLEDFGEDWTGAGEKRSVKVWAKRKGIPSRREIVFGYEQALKGGLVGKETYKSWGDDMYARRAWGRLYYRLFPDVLKGMKIAEMEQDAPDDNDTAAAAVEQRINDLGKTPETAK